MALLHDLVAITLLHNLLHYHAYLYMKKDIISEDFMSQCSQILSFRSGDKYFISDVQLPPFSCHIVT